tara:strand:+ start:7622 stop:11002 length:3381 start_codon:yes stop_codon:yes gene_type:complete
MFRKSLTGEKHITATSITADSVNTKSIVDEEGINFENSIKTGNLIDNHKELLSSLKPLGTAGTGTFNTISPHAVDDRPNDCIVVFEHDKDAVSHHFISCKLQDAIIKMDKIHADMKGVVADNSANKFLKTDSAYSAFHTENIETSGKWTFTTEPVYKTGGVEYVLQHAQSTNIVGHHATNNSSSTHPKIGATGTGNWDASASSGVGAVQYIVVNNTNGQLQTEKKKQTYHKINYKPSNYTESDILVVAGNDIHKSSPYYIMTTDTDGKLLAKFLWSTDFNMFPMGSTAGGADARPVSDRYKQGLVPEGSGTHNDEFLRKDGTWASPPTSGFVNPTSVVALGGIADGSKFTDDDADNFMELGRGKLGYNGTDSDVFSVAHRDNFSNVNYALSQDANGATMLNSKTGQLLTLRVNDTIVQQMDADEITFKGDAIVDASHILRLNNTSGNILATTDNDISFTIGRGQIGYNGTDTDAYCVAHRDNFTGTDYALLQLADGNTIINAKSGTNISFKINDHATSIAYISSTAFIFNKYILNEVSSGVAFSSTDADTQFIFGRASFLGISDGMYLGHRDNTNSTDFAINQLHNGATTINSKSGQGLHGAIGGVVCFDTTASDFTFAVNAVVNSSHNLNLQATSGTPFISTDNDIIFEMGRGKVGYNGTDADAYCVAHRDNFNGTDYSLLQLADGNTIINAKSGQVISFKINDATSTAFISSTTFTSNVEMVNNVLSGTAFSSTDNDIIFEMGRGKIGYDGTNGDTFTLAHRDLFDGNQYMIRQDFNGYTYLNAITGSYITFRINNNEKMRMTTNKLLLKGHLEVDSSHNIELKKTSGTIFESTDDDTIFEFGRGKVGYATNSDEFAIGHRDCFIEADLALAQTELGETIVNAKTGKKILLKINNTSIVEISATEAIYKKKIEFAGDFGGRLIDDGTAMNTSNDIFVGGARIGYWEGGAGYGAFYNKGNSTAGNYALLAGSTDTYLNASTTIYARINNSTTVMTMSSSALQIYGTTEYTSDRRIKDEIEDADDYWDAFKTIKIKKYKKITKDATDKKRLGVIADDIEVNTNEMISNAFSQGTANNPMELNDGTSVDEVKKVQYDQLYRMSMTIIQQLQTRVEALETIIQNNNLS